MSVPPSDRPVRPHARAVTRVTATSVRRLARTLLVSTAAAAVGLACIVASPAQADPTPAKTTSRSDAKSTAKATTTLTSAARKAGLKQPGQAYMGWYEKAAAKGLVSDASLTKSYATGSTATASAGTVSAQASAGVRGMDVSSWQGSVAWRSHVAQGRRFAYVKASEGTGYTNPYFGAQYTGSYNAGMVRGSYHFALPNKSWARTQARYFVANGGGWSADGKTLPGVLDIEYNPYGATCYGRSKTDMVRWVRNFSIEYKRLTKRDVVIYTTADWWSQCTGNSTAFAGTNPLWVARYSSSPGKLPGGWGFYTFWQYSSSPFDKNHFSASLTQLRRLARG